MGDDCAGMSTSLIIPTLNRPNDLDRCLRSVARLDPGFDEIVLVEQGDARRTRVVADRFPGLPVTVLELAEPSSARARNAGIERARGDCLFFVDDDVELPPDYVRAALDGFRDHPRTVGLTGSLRHGRESVRHSALRRLLHRCLYTLLLVRAWRSNRVLRSGSNCFAHGAPAPSCPAHEVQWLPGCHCVYRRQVFDDGFRFDPGFVRWGFGEDVLLSYRIHKRYGPGALRFDPAFALTHHLSTDGSQSAEAAVRRMVIYRFVFWRSEVYRGSPLNLLCYLAGQPGFVLFHWAGLCATGRWRNLRAAAGAYLFLLRRWRAVADGRIDYNRFVLDGTP